MYWHDMAWWGWIPMTLAMAALWGLLIWLVVRLLSGGGPARGPSEMSARQILDTRFAQGELGAREYEEARQLLEDGRAHAGDRSA